MANPPENQRLGASDLARVGFGGAVGTLLRVSISALLPVTDATSTLAINVVGALLLGLLTALFAGRRPRAQLLLGTGLCGGFTTYSAFAAGVAGLLLTGQVFGALLLACGTVLCAASATVLGLWAGGRIARSPGTASERGVA